MDDLRVDLCFVNPNPLVVRADPEISVGEWTELRMRELLTECTGLFVQEREVVRQSRIRTFAVRLLRAVLTGDSADIICLMCDLTNPELRDVVSAVVESLGKQGLKTIAVRVDDFDRIVLFDEKRNKGFAMAPSGSYQRVSRFYDGSYRYGIELLMDQSLRSFVDGIFREIKQQIA